MLTGNKEIPSTVTECEAKEGIMLINGQLLNY